MTSARPDTWMPVYIGDYLADTQHLSRDLHGSYLLLLFAMWRAGGELADDDRRLAAIAKATPRQWKDDRPILAEFFQIANGVWRHKRVDEELATADAFIAQRSAAGRASAEQRERQRKSSDSSTSVQRDPQRKSKTSPSPSQEDSEDDDASHRAADASPHPQAELLPPEENPVKSAIFSEGLAWLMHSTGDPERSCRGFLGKLIAEHGETCTLNTLDEARRKNPVDPRGWIRRNINGGINGQRPRNESRSKPGSEAPQADGIAAAFARRSMQP